jgi:hypothetical protein
VINLFDGVAMTDVNQPDKPKDTTAPKPGGGVCAPPEGGDKPAEPAKKPA